MPRYTLIAAMSVDGKIARTKNSGTRWTSPEDKQFLRIKLDRCDVVIVGRRTYEIAQKPLAKRNCIVFTRSVEQAVKKNKRCVYFNPQKGDLEAFLKEHGYKNVCVLGGAQTYSWFLKRGLTDDLYLTIEPVVFGKGVSLFTAPSCSPFTLASVKRLNQKGSLLLHYISAC